MRLIRTFVVSLLAAFSFVVAMGVVATPASAQATRTWVSGVGDDANPCSRTAPCKTFAGAISKTATNGEINCLDSAGFGGVTITKSITIDCHTEHGGILSLNVNGVLVNSSTAKVTLRGLVINGAGGTTGNGIRILAASQVNIDDCIIEGFAGTTTNGRGVTIETATAGVRVTIQNSRFDNNNNFAIHSNPSAGGVTLDVTDSTIVGGGTTAVQLRQLTTAALDNVTIVNTPAGTAALTLELTTVTANVSNSLFANNGIGIFNGNGGSPTARLFNTVITGSTSQGLQINSGSVFSYGNNGIRGNAGNEAPTGAPTGTQ